MADLSHRSSQLEIMDDLESSGQVLDQSLHELEFINKWLGGNDVTLHAFDRMFDGKPRQTVYRIADLGCGGGDMARHIYEWGRKHGYSFEVVGIDANPNVIAFARKNVVNSAIRFETLNIFSEEFQKMNFDVVIGTLFYHHFTRDELISFFRLLRPQLRVGLIINDIHRHPLAYHSIKLLTSLFSKSSMVIHDAPLSVHRAFKKTELKEILTEAGYPSFSIQWKWAFRWEVIARVK